MRFAPFVLAFVVGCSGGDESSNRTAGGGQGAGVSGGMGAGSAGDFGNSGGATGGSGAGTGGTSGAGQGGTGGAGGTAGPTNPTGVEPAMIDHCPGPLAQADVDALRAGGPVDAMMRFLYPYEGTVFPRGLEAPLLQWDAAASGINAIYVHLSSIHFDYQGCFTGTTPGRATIPADVWDAAFRANEGPADALLMEVTTQGGGVVSGPISTRVTLARATLKGAIYYNTYGSALAASQGTLNGVVMRVMPGQPTPDVFVVAQTPSIAGDICVGCHSVSADGTRMVVEEHSGIGLTYNTSLSYALTANQAPKPAVDSQLGNSKAAFSAIYPDGSRYLTTGRPEAGPFSTGMSVNGTFGPEPAALWDTATGTEIPNSGIPQFAKMPSFSPNGTMVAFNDQDAAGALALMDFDPATNQFTNWRMLATDPVYIGWPFFLPDDSGVVYATTEAPGYTPMAGGDLTGTILNPGMLKVAHVASSTVVPLARAMGYRDQAMTDPYVPYGTRDLDVDYMPTVSPVAAGGYFWVFFTSKRNYGNVKVNPVLTVDSKKIWVSALSIPGAAAPGFDLAAGEDPSHPPFLLPGQELESGNLRAFASLNPCKADGESCETGIDCCTGFCTNGVCGRPPPPPEEPPPCSNLDETCETVADCCDGDKPSIRCIAGFCAYAPVVD